MNDTTLLRTIHTSIEAAYNGFGTTTAELENGHLDSSDIADLLLADARIESAILYPTKPRADRRRKTAKKHHRLDVINSYYYTGEEERHEYQLKPNKKKSASRVKMDRYPDLRNSKDYDFAESLAEYEYQVKVDVFYKLVNKYLEDAQRSQGCLVVYTEIEDGDYNPEIQDFEPRFVNSHSYHKDRYTAELELSEAFNEDFEPTFLEVADEYDAATSACLEMRYQKFIPEPICHIFFCEKTGTRWFTDISGTCYRQLPGQKPIEWEEYDIDDDENDFFFEPDECFPFDDDDDDMPEFVDETPKTEKKYPFDDMSDVAKAIYDFFMDKN